MRSSIDRIATSALAVAWLATTAHAQPQGSPGAPSASPPTASADPGDLRVLVFVDAEPATGVAISVGSARTQHTDSDGVTVFTLPEGDYQVRLDVPWSALPAARPIGPPLQLNTELLRVVADEEVEMIVTLTARGELAKVDVESANQRSDRQRAEDFEQRRRTLPQGIVRGKLYVAEGKNPVAGAQIFVRGAPVETESDEQGLFQLELPEGKYDLVIIHRKYITINLKDVDVDANRPKELRVAAEAATAQLADFVVTAPHIEGGVASLVAERRASASVDDVIGVEEMSRSGDSNAAGALRRVTGITVVGGQFVYVRGLGERYSSTLLNGQMIPSPEPERRVIPLDLFSTGVLESVVIQKTQSPDAPGEFGGGVVRLRTKKFPSEFTLDLSLSTGMVSTATFQSRPRYRGGSTDFLGFDDGGRQVPALIAENSPLTEGNRFQDGFTVEELAEMGRLLPNNYAITEKRINPNLGVNATVGNAYKLAGKPSGFLLSAGWGNSYGFSDEVNRRFVVSTESPDGLQLNNDFAVSQLSQTVGVNGIFVTGIEPAEGHEIRATSLLLRIADSAAGVLTGRSDDLGRDIEQFRLDYVERQLLTQQLNGTHEIAALSKGKLEWRFAYSRASRDEPDRREYFYADDSVDPDKPPADFQISARPAGNQRIWNFLTDQIQDYGLDYTHPLPAWKQQTIELKVGTSLIFRNRKFNTLRLTMRAPRMLSAEDRRLPAEEIWSEDNINAVDGWILEDTTQPTDAYTASQGIQAGYAMATVPLDERIEFTGGARVERSRQEVLTFSPFATDEMPMRAELDNTDVLPSATLKWQVSDELTVRGGYGRSVTRPDFRELSESSYRDVITATRFVGNPELERGTIDHLDARAEYYFSTDELVSIAAFYKAFDSPIERIDRGGVDRTVSWDNAESARNLGVELELRRRFEFLGERYEEFFGAANLAFINSQVRVTEGVGTSQERALQGQSPYVINLQLGFDDALDSGITAVFLYNVFGPRIRDVGRLGAPDIFEQPFHQLDFVYSHRFRDHWKLKFKAQNLLDQQVRFRQGARTPRSFRNGRSFGVSLSWSH